MNEQNETIADLVAGLRVLADSVSNGIVVIQGDELADRIEAAWKREAATPKSDPGWKDICAKCNDGIEPKHCQYYGEPNGCNSPIYGEHPTTEKSSAVGNMAKIRKALNDATGLLESIFNAFSNGTSGPYMSDVAESIDNARAALSAPPRNCDRFATVKDAAIAFARERQDAPQPCPDFTFSAWLLAPATEKKGGNDGR